MPHHPSILRMTLLLAAVVAVVTSAAASSEEQQQCLGKDPMLSVATFLDMELDYETADRICCHNHRFAEPKGYHEWPEVDFYNRLDPNTEHVFYDSVCGIPLFVAPRGRTFDEFVAESILHGWPSFRPAELVSENVIIHEDGRMESKCKTHLGHNLPKDGVDRYCIDLVCMAGTPPMMASNNETMSTSTSTSASSSSASADAEVDVEEILEDELGDDIITASDFDAGSYESSALERSGKEPKNKFIVVVAIVIPVLLTIGGLYLVRRWYLAKRNIDPSEKEPKTLDLEDPTKEQPPVA